MKVAVLLLALALPLAAYAAPAITAPAAGAVVSSPVTITVAPDGAMQHGAHWHIVVDADLPAPGAHIPMDAHHMHLMHGATNATINLQPGQHTVQLIAGSAGHTVAANAVHSDPITFTVK